jgi:hypothetical protein
MEIAIAQVYLLRQQWRVELARILEKVEIWDYHSEKIGGLNGSGAAQ